MNNDQDLPESGPNQAPVEYDKPSDNRGFSSETSVEYDFRGRRPDERVVMVARYHAWLLMPIVAIWLIMLLLLWGLFWIFGASAVTSIAIAVIVVVGLLYTFYQWFLWNNGTSIITTQRVIRIEQQSLFSRQIAEAELDRIQEISTEIRGPIHTLFNFGTVRIKTATNSGKVDLMDVTNPYDIQQEIVRVQRQLVTQRPTNP